MAARIGAPCRDAGRWQAGGRVEGNRGQREGVRVGMAGKEAVPPSVHTHIFSFLDMQRRDSAHFQYLISLL